MPRQLNDIYWTFLNGWRLKGDSWYTDEGTKLRFGYFRMDAFIDKYLIRGQTTDKHGKSEV
jgi:hypothetical protein